MDPGLAADPFILVQDLNLEATAAADLVHIQEVEVAPIQEVLPAPVPILDRAAEADLAPAAGLGAEADLEAEAGLEVLEADPVLEATVAPVLEATVALVLEAIVEAVVEVAATVGPVLEATVAVEATRAVEVGLLEVAPCNRDRWMKITTLKEVVVGVSTNSARAAALYLKKEIQDVAEFVLHAVVSLSLLPLSCPLSF